MGVAWARHLPLAKDKFQEKGLLEADGSVCNTQCPSLGVLGTSRLAAQRLRLS